MHVLTGMASMQLTTRMAEDAADHAAFITGWQQHYAQLSCGRYQGRLDELCLPRLQLFREFSSCETWQHCQAWPDAVWFGIPRPGAGGQLRYCGRSVPAYTVLLSPGGSDFTLRTPPGFLIYGMVLPLALLDLHAQLLTGSHAPASWRHSGMLTLPATAYAQLCQTLDSILDTPAASAAPSRLAQASITALIQALLQAQGSDGLCRSSIQQRHLAWVEAACALAASPADALPTVDELCARLHVTRRTLQNGFQEVVATSPLQWLRALRLHHVRQALRTTPADDTPINDLAAAWGFVSPSHFSYDYRRQFGETPSQTRQLSRL
ncbi:helix-turn-helix domain-containing protein [Vogesella urethralis]|uniref:helix-turn-helix domain-containing protein n=1 Tax=Vogesella urethralis TaxID=2592656 RepID=UPI0011861DC8|nr:helix-turn-helix domain-containing protein [Vogesella urethralis]